MLSPATATASTGSFLPSELWSKIYKHLFYLIDCKQKTLSYLTINRLALECLEPLLYQTLFLTAAHPFPRYTGYIDPRTRWRYIVEKRSSSFVQKHVKALSVELYSSVGANDALALSHISRCTGITRLSFRYSDPIPSSLVAAINHLPVLRVLEVTLIHFCIILGAYHSTFSQEVREGLTVPAISKPLWLITLTHLHLSRTSEDSAWISVIQQTSLDAFVNLANVAVQFTSEERLIISKFCSTFLTYCPSLDTFLVQYEPMDDMNTILYKLEDMSTYDELQEIASTLRDPRIVVYIDLIEEFSEDSFLPGVANNIPDTPLNDWRQLYCNPDGEVNVWKWARQAKKQRSKFIRRTIENDYEPVFVTHV
ncbi:hypothetical protein DL96DRAFT_1811582 [Flagelloscypha sp. PMI_526]|nr:hypothetical protein DL96DRAFT_1811582 [Flagelloscypha sp. PMI_526]